MHFTEQHCNQILDRKCRSHITLSANLSALMTGLARKARKERNTKVKKVRGKEKIEVRSGKAVAKKKDK